MPTLIIHDRFQFRGGAERLVLDLARILDADIATEFWTDETFAKSDAPHKVFVLDEGEPKAMVWRYFRAQWNFWWKTRNLIKNYDTIIFSGNNCLAAALRPLGNKKILYYCHTPVRYVYDLLEHRRNAETSSLKRFFFYDVGKYLIRGLYRLGLSRIKTIVTNSTNVQKRIKHYCDRDAIVVYPPIQTNKFRWLGQGDYYVSSARLDELKRVEDIVKAFQRMPDKKLIVTSGGDRAEAVRELAQGHSNIQVVGWVNNEQLEDLIGNCIATIYIPIDEDFGMTPLEGMAAGKPCIGVDEGGLQETIIDGKNGLLIPAKYTINNLVHAVQEMTPERALSMRLACEERAREFSLEHFATAIKNVLEKI